MKSAITIICLGLVLGLIGSDESSASISFGGRNHFWYGLSSSKGNPLETPLLVDSIIAGMDKADDLLDRYINRDGVSREKIIKLFAQVKQYRKALSEIPGSSSIKNKLMVKIDYFIARLLGGLGITSDYDY